MIKQMFMVECDICGKLAKPKHTMVRNEEDVYTPPDGWIRSRANPSVIMCPECNKKLEVTDERRSL